MRKMRFSQAIDDALACAMAQDGTIVVFGEDVQMLRRNLYVRFGGDRVRNTPISEAAFLGAAVGAAMAGLHPVVEVMMVDFVAVAVDALLNHAAKLRDFSGGAWEAPMVVRSACGAGYGDGGQHGQTLWGWLAHIPGMAVVVPSTPADAGGLMTAALQHGGPVVFLEHKLISEEWLEFLGSGGRATVSYDVPQDGARGLVPDRWEAIPIGEAVCRCEGTDLTMVSLGVGVHRCLEAARMLQAKGIHCGVVDLRSVAPLDRQTVCREVAKTGRMLVVDEDYEAHGLSGELAAAVLEGGLQVHYARVCTKGNIPYSCNGEYNTLPNVSRIVEAALELVKG